MFQFKDRLFQTKVKVASKFVFEDFDIGVLKNFRGFLKNFRSFVNIILNFHLQDFYTIQNLLRSV